MYFWGLSLSGNPLRKLHDKFYEYVPFYIYAPQSYGYPGKINQNVIRNDAEADNDRPHRRQRIEA